MRRWFLSYTSQDFALAQALKVALKRKDSNADIFFAPESMRAGGFWKPQLAAEIENSTAFILLIGEKGLGDWQVMEYYEALDRRAKEPHYPIILILSAKRPAPGLPFARQLHWVLTEDPASEATIGNLVDAASGPAQRPGELWRFTRPYRGLESMTEANSDYFFGRDRKTVEVIDALASAPGKLPILLGNSGVGKSSLAQAGVLAALLRQGWSDKIKDVASWPDAFQDSRRWCCLTARPGTQPLQALVALFFDTWQYAATSAERVKEEKAWIELLREGKAALPDLLDATERRYRELAQTAPPAFLLYIDQGEELYVRAEQRESRRFSEILAHSLGDARLRALMSMRSDFLGQLQRDEALFEAHRKIDVPPLREPDLREVVNRPAELLNARFESEGLAAYIAHGTAEESAKDAGALPLLSYLLDDMWTQMVERADGTLRLPSAVFDLGGVLVRRANAFVSRHPHSEDVLRRVFTLKLATVREDGDATRRLALRSEFSDEEWRLVSELADHPNRLLVTATPEGGETYAEVAHEAIFRRWDKLLNWIAAEREFLAWRTSLETARRAWQATPQASKQDALLMGLALAQAQAWIMQRAEDVPKADREFIDQSLNREALERIQRERRRRLAQIVSAAAAVVFAVLAGIAFFAQKKANDQALRALDAQLETERRQVNLLAELATSENLRGNLDTALRLGVHTARLSLALDKDKTEISAPRAALASTVWQSDWRLMLGGQKDRATSAVFSPDGTRIVTGADDKTARIWDAATGKEIAVLRGHEDDVWSAAFSPDGARVVTASSDTTARIWDATTANEIAVLRGHENNVWSAAFSPDGTRIVTGSSDRTARIWDAATGNEIAVLRGHEATTVYSAAFSPDGTRVVTGSDDKTARIWDAATGNEIAVLRGHENEVESAAFSPDGTRVVTASGRWDTGDKTARIWDAAAGKEIAVLRGHENGVRSAAFSPDGARVVTASSDRTARIWDAATGDEIAVLRHENEVRCAAFNPDGTRIVTASKNKTARIWDAAIGKEIAVLRGHEDEVLSAAFSPDGTHIVTASSDGTARIWDVTTGNKMAVLRGHENGVYSAAFNPDGTRILTASRDMTARIWDAATAKEIAMLRGHENTVTSAAFSPDGTRIVTASMDNTARIWDAATATEIEVLRGHEDGVLKDGVMSAAFSSDGTRVVTGADDKTARIWDAATGNEIAVLRGLEGSVRSAAFSPDGTRIVAASGDGTARIWDAATAKEIAVLRGHEAWLTSVVFSPDGTRIVTASGDKTARIWDAATAKEIAVLRGHEDFVRSAAFSPDGTRIVTASSDRTARIWDAAAGKEIAVLRGHEDDVWSAAFSPDGARVVTASSDRTARIWDVHIATVSTKDLVAVVCARMRDLTTLSRDEMRLAGYPESMPEIDVCTGVK